MLILTPSPPPPPTRAKQADSLDLPFILISTNLISTLNLRPFGFNRLIECNYVKSISILGIL